MCVTRTSSQDGFLSPIRNDVTAEVSHDERLTFLRWIFLLMELLSYQSRTHGVGLEAYTVFTCFVV